MAAYYNEHDRFNVEWLKHLMAANLIAPPRSGFVGAANRLWRPTVTDRCRAGPKRRIGRSWTLCGPQATAFIKAAMECLNE